MPLPGPNGTTNLIVLEGKPLACAMGEPTAESASKLAAASVRRAVLRVFNGMSCLLGRLWLPVGICAPEFQLEPSL